VKRLSRRDRVLLATWAAVVVILAVVVALVLPVRRQWRKVSSEVLGLQRAIAEAATMYRQAPQLTKEIANLRATAHALSRSDSEVGSAIIKQVDQLSKDLGVRLLSIRPGEPQVVESCRKHTVVFEVECDFSRIARMLYQLEQAPPQLWVEGVEISSERMAGEEVRAKLTVAAYTLTGSTESGRQGQVRAP